MKYSFVLFLLLGIYELGLGIRQCANVAFSGLSYQTIYGTFDNPGPYSMFVVILLPIAWFYIWQIKSLLVVPLLDKLLIIQSVVYVVLSFIVLPFCMSRTSWIAAFVSCGIVTYFVIQKYVNQKIPKRYIALFFSVALLFIGFIYGLKKDSADGRLLIWKISVGVIKENFIGGVGQGYFSGVYGEAQGDYFFHHSESEHEKYIAGAPDFAYNEYLQIILEHGIVGLLILILVLGYTLYHLVRMKDQCKIPLIGALVSLLIVSFFSYPLRNFYTCLLAVCLIFLIMLFPEKNESLKKKISRCVLFSFLLFFVLYKVSVSFGVIGNVRTAYKQWDLLKPHFNAEQYDEITLNYAALYPYLKSNAAFLFEYGQCLSKTGLNVESNCILKEGLCRSSDPMFLNILGKNYQRLGEYQLAEEAFYKAYYRIPHKIYPLYLLMTLYKEQGREQEMLSMAYKIINQKNKVESGETEYIKNKVRKELEQKLDSTSMYEDNLSDDFRIKR